jgi:hypothetical protein
VIEVDDALADLCGLSNNVTNTVNKSVDCPINHQPLEEDTHE